MLWNSYGKLVWTVRSFYGTRNLPKLIHNEIFLGFSLFQIFDMVLVRLQKTSRLVVIQTLVHNVKSMYGFIQTLVQQSINMLLLKAIKFKNKQKSCNSYKKKPWCWHVWQRTTQNANVLRLVYANGFEGALILLTLNSKGLASVRIYNSSTCCQHLQNNHQLTRGC